MRLLIGLGVLAAMSSAQAPGDRLAVETKVWVAAKLYASIQMYYAHAEGATDFVLDRDYQQFLKAAFATDDRRKFDLASMASSASSAMGTPAFMTPGSTRTTDNRSGSRCSPWPKVGWLSAVGFRT